MRIAQSYRTARVNVVADDLDSGIIELYTEPRPANANTAVGGATLLGVLHFGDPAFGAAVDGVRTANTIAGEDAGLANGAIAWARIKLADGTTVVFDSSVSDNPAAPPAEREILVGNVNVSTGLAINILSFILREPVGA